MTQSDISQHMRVLGVSHGATADAVRKAWRNAVLKSHPDISRSGSTDKMIRINAAYEFLKNGVPEPTPMQNPDADHGSHAPSHGRVFSESSAYQIKNRYLCSTKEMRKKWTEVARAEMASRGILFEEGGWIRRTLNIKKKIPIFVPHDFVVTGTKLELVLQNRPMKKGRNRIYVPHLVPQNGRLAVADTGHLFSLILERDVIGLHHYRTPGLDRFITPGFSGLKVFLSTV